MTRIAKILTVLALIVAVGVAILYATGLLFVHQAAAMPAPLVAATAPKAAPRAPFYDPQGGRHSLADDKGHYVLVNFWATWCAPCVAELPALARLKAADPGITVLAVDVTGHQETAQMTQAFLKSHNAAALEPMLDKDGAMMRSFILYGMPTTVLVDPRGREIARAVGPGNWASPAFMAYFKGLK